MATGELSLAEEDPEEGLSVLTRHMVDGLRGKADVNRDGIITLTELSRYVHKQVIDFHDQKPTEAGLGIQGDLAISKSGFEPEKELCEKIMAHLAAWKMENTITFKVAAEAEDILEKGRDLQIPSEIGRRGLLEQIVYDDLKPGAFLEKWFQIAAEAKPPVIEKEPGPNLEMPPPQKRPPADPPPSPPGPWRSDTKAESRAGVHKPNPEDGVVVSVLWVLIGLGVVGLAAGLFEANNISLSGYSLDKLASGLFIGTSIAAFLCLRWYQMHRHKLGWVAKLVCFTGTAAYSASGVWLLTNMSF